jgi:hypothetical protein
MSLRSFARAFPPGPPLDVRPIAYHFRETKLVGLTKGTVNSTTETTEVAFDLRS